MGRRTAVAHRLIRPRARTCAPTEHMFKERLCLPESLIKAANETQFQSCISEALKCIWDTFSRCQRSLSSHVFFVYFSLQLESWQQNQIQTLILKKTFAPESNEAIVPPLRNISPLLLSVVLNPLECRTNPGVRLLSPNFPVNSYPLSLSLHQESD